MDKLGNGQADLAADFGRRSRYPQVWEAERLWYVLAISRRIVNHARWQ